VSLAAEARLEKLLAKGAPSGVFFLHGDAGRLRDEAARRLVDHALDPATRDFNLDVFHGSDLDPEALAAALSMPPVMAPRRVVALFEAERLTPTGIRVVEAVLEKFPPDLTFVVTAEIPRKSRKALYRTLKSAGTSLEWSAPRDREVPGWLVERARARWDRDLTPAAAEALAEAVGSDLGLLEAELEKLAAAGGDEIDVDRVRALVPNVREVNRWSWMDMVVARDYGSALRQLPYLLGAPGESAVGLIIGLVDGHLMVGIATEGGSRAVGEALDRLKKPYLKFKVRTWTAQARRWTAPELDRALQLLERADRRAKTGSSDRAVLEELLLELEVLRRKNAA
jgi:DNA polymerase-3 subunit delta